MPDDIPPPPPTQPAPTPAVTPPATVPATENSGLQPNIAAALASFFLLIGGIIFLVLEKRDKFVRFYAMQSVIIGGGGLAISVVLQILAMVFAIIPVLGKLIGYLLGVVMALLMLAMTVLAIVMAVKAFSGKEWEVPYIGPVARKQLESGKPV
jgi:uncharacterized membrane protein